VTGHTDDCDEKTQRGIAGIGNVSRLQIIMLSGGR
jgi:hypothetical protein